MIREPVARKAPETATVPAVRPAVPARPGPDAVLARRALEAGAGNRAVSRLLARAKTEKQLEREWSEQGPLGKKAYELLKKELPYEKLAKLIKEKVAPLAQQAAEEAMLKQLGVEKGKGAVTMMDSSGAFKSLTGKDAKWAEKAADDWLKSPEGKAYLAKLQTETLEHPEIAYKAILGIVAAAIAGGAVAYFSGAVDPPLLEKRFELGKGWSLSPGVDFGKWGSAGLLQQGKLGADWDWSKKGSMGIDTSLKHGEKGYSLLGDYHLRLGDAKKPDFGFNIGYGYDWGTGAHTLLGGIQAQEYLKASVKAILSETGKGDTVSGSVSGKAGGFDYKAAATWGLDEKTLKELTLHLGFSNEAKTLSFLNDLAIEHKDGAYSVKGNAALQVAINRITLKFGLEAGYSAAAGIYGRGTGSIEVPIHRNWSIVGSGALGYGRYDALPAVAPGLLWSAGLGVKREGAYVLPQLWASGGGGLPPAMGLGFDLMPLFTGAKKDKK